MKAEENYEENYKFENRIENNEQWMKIKDGLGKGLKVQT